MLNQGSAVDTLMLIVDGKVNVEMDGKQMDTLGQGRLLGGIAFLNRQSDFVSPVTVIATEQTRIITWSFADLETQIKKGLEMEVAVEASIGLEISRFLQTARLQLV